MQKSGCDKNSHKDAKLSKRQFVAKMASKYAKFSKNAVCGKNGKKICNRQICKIKLKKFVVKRAKNLQN